MGGENGEFGANPRPSNLTEPGPLGKKRGGVSNHPAASRGKGSRSSRRFRENGLAAQKPPTGGGSELAQSVNLGARGSKSATTKLTFLTGQPS